MESRKLQPRGKSPLCDIEIGLFSDTRVFIKSRSQSPRFQGTTDKKPSRGHMRNPHGDTYASTVRIQFIYISPFTDIPLERSLS
ncbi:hypothetical protein ALC62_06092 [Cyphomyrmex costatus]|uniref:Uncharacterized protein n=1 Tax=Cyphomyrmex costatus TaxID=456900 RepID=A0A195CQH7_9HYME|nr:hypothetical protein ALC62_06092 [Cyphomyrmex costatus]